MMKFIKRPLEEMGFNFIDPEFIPKGKDEYYLRQIDQTKRYRKLRAHEIETLIYNSNQADDWNNISVTDNFNPQQVKRTRFKGIIRIGDLDSFYLEYHDIKLPVGIYDSTIVSCDLGNNVAINNVNYMAHYQIDDEVILFNINELITTQVAKFGNGVVKEGENEASRIEIELGNENGGRAVLPFDGILSADIFLWSKYRDDKALLEKFKLFTEQDFDAKRGHYGQIGKQTIIKNCLLVKDANIGPCAYIKGVNKLKNVTVNSSEQARTQIGEGVEAVNGIIGKGCRIFYGSKAVRFVMGEASQLKYGARLINSYLGANSTISCCEVLNSLIYPYHEQHHNNSFLCASTVYGQSNLAAGATIGSNHNSRAADGEILAGRGFWPGLCVSLKHNSKFASFVLIAKGDFPAELDVKFPFALVSNNLTENKLEIMPAYWFMYNMYALARNSWKYTQRDKRTSTPLDIEQDYLAPDSVNEVFEALYLIERSVGESFGSQFREEEVTDHVEKGKELLEHHPEEVKKLEVLVQQVENSKRKVKLIKPLRAYHMYKQMIVLYGIQNLLKHCKKTGETPFQAIKTTFKNCKRKQFLNLGGQLIETLKVEKLKSDVKSGTINSWDVLHKGYQTAQEQYHADKMCHAIVSMLEVKDLSAETLTEEGLSQLVAIALETKQHINENTYASRKKDHTNHFRKMMYNNQEEMDEVIGKFEDNSFIAQIKEETKVFELDVQRYLKE